MAIWEHSAGIIPFRTRGKKREYLMLLSNLAKNAYWEFPKGLIEKGEKAAQAATREFQEETGINEYEAVPEFKKVLKYFYRRDGNLIGKTVTYFLGHVPNARVKISEESQDYKWVTKQEAARLKTHKSLLDLLEEADQFLDKHKQKKK
jgi:8-oxo-dGTP pyrophosphatase MutT (NUDIX family)